MSDESNCGSCDIHDDSVVIIPEAHSDTDASRQTQAAEPSTSFADQLKALDDHSKVPDHRWQQTPTAKTSTNFADELKALDDERKALNQRHDDLIKAERRRYGPLIDEINAIHEDLEAARGRCNDLEEKEHELQEEYGWMMAELDEDSDGAMDRIRTRHHRQVLVDSPSRDPHEGSPTLHTETASKGVGESKGDMGRATSRT